MEGRLIMMKVMVTAGSGSSSGGAVVADVDPSSPSCGCVIGATEYRSGAAKSGGGGASGCDEEERWRGAPGRHGGVFENSGHDTDALFDALLFANQFTYYNDGGYESLDSLFSTDAMQSAAAAGDQGMGLWSFDDSCLFEKLLKRRERAPGIMEGSCGQGGEGADVVRVGVGTPWRGQVGGAACEAVERVSSRGHWELTQRRLSHAERAEAESCGRFGAAIRFHTPPRGADRRMGYREGGL
ncbi:hypothetical protein ABZP36_012172 [Zizania latifolia]